jgi:hypothetical protein
MGKLRWLISQSLIKKYVMGGGGYKLLTPDYMTDLHLVVVNYISQVIGGVAIRLEQYQVIEGTVLEFYITPDNIIKPCLPFKRSLETDYRLDTLGRLFRPHFLTQVTAMTVITRWLLALDLLGPHLLKALRRAVAIIGIPL